jgi:glycopeptide antibiotics resistance protein
MADHNFIPFRTIRMYIVYYRYFQFDIWFSNLFGNVLFFMPLGFFLPCLFAKLRRGWLVILISLCASGGAEILQWNFQVGGFDVDDILLNTLGGICGYWLFARVRKTWSKIKIEIWR